MLKVFFLMTMIFSFTNSLNAKSLEEIRKDGKLYCGVVNSVKGVSIKDDKGEWSGYFVDLCRAIGVAIFNDTNKAIITEIDDKDVATALKSDKIDVLSAPLPITYQNATTNEIAFSYPVYFDTVGFVAHTKDKIKKLSDAKGATLCYYDGYPFKERLDDYITQFKDNVKLKENKNFKEALTNYEKGQCNILATVLVNARIIAKTTESNVLADSLLDVAYGIGVKDVNERLLKASSWAFYAMVMADDFGINSENVDGFSSSEDEDIKLFLNNKSGVAIGSTADWFYNIIKKVGSYDEIYSKNLGKKSGFDIETKNNKSWRDKGAIFSPLLN